MGGPSLKQKIKQKLLKPKYTPHTEEEALHLCSTVRSGSADIVLDAFTPATSRGSSRPASTEPTSQDAHGYHDITASLLVDDAAAARKNDQVGRGSVVKATPSSRGPFKGCLSFGKPVTANEGLPTAFNNRQSILGRLNKAAKKPAQPTPPPQAKPKPAGKAAVKPKKCQHPLHMAAWRTNITELQDQLMKPGADVNKRDKNSMTPLHYAAWQGSVDCVQLLLEYRADINKADAEGMLPIHFAAMFNRLDVAAMLLDRGSLLQPPPAKKGRLAVSWPTTPLVAAAKMGHTDMVSLLMDRGADVAGVSKTSKSALHEAALCGHADVVAEMLRKGADHELALPKTGYRALHLAALKGSQPVVQVLLLGGADVDVRAKDGRTPLHVACEHGNMEAAAALIGLGGADLSLRDNSGVTPLHVAVDKNHLLLAKTLMDRGAAVDTTTNLGALPLNFAHDPDFYKLLRAVRWYSAASCPTGNNPSSSTYWSPPGAMEAAAAVVINREPTAAAAAPAPGSSGLPEDFFDPAAAAPGLQYFADYGSCMAASSAPAAAAAAAEPTTQVAGPQSSDVVPRYQAPSPTKGFMVGLNPAGSATAAAGASGFSAMYQTAGVSSKGLFGKLAAQPKPSKAFPASNWLKSLRMQGGKKSKTPLAATMALAQGGYAPLSEATTPQLPSSSSAVEFVPSTASPVGAAAVGAMPASAGEEAAAAGQSRSNSRSSSISLMAGMRSTHHSPSPSEGSSIVAQRAAAEIARAAVAAVVERAAREEEGARPVAQAAAIEHMPHRSATSSPETWSCTSSVPVRPASGVTASAASGVTTQAALRRLLGFEDNPANFDILGKVAPGDVGARRSLGDQDKWMPGAVATPSSAATFAAFAAEASEQDDVKAAAALAATTGGSSRAPPATPEAAAYTVKPGVETTPAAAAAAAAFSAAAAAAAATAPGGTYDADAVKQGSPSGGSAGKSSAGKKVSKAAGKVLRPWRA